MKKFPVIFGIIVLSLSGCASIMSGRNQTMTFQSTPEYSNISILNRAGEKIHVGQAPVTVNLKRGAGFFKPEKYQVTFEKDGYETKTINITSSINGWYIGNILFGGWIGLLIVDPATGAMYSLNTKEKNIVLNDLKNTAIPVDAQSLTIISTNEVSRDILENAKPIKLQAE
jgi:hypothetical protein